MGLGVGFALRAAPTAPALGMSSADDGVRVSVGVSLGALGLIVVKSVTAVLEIVETTLPIKSPNTFH